MTALRLAQLSDLHLGPLPWHSLRGFFTKRLSGWLSWQLRRHRQHRVATIERLLADMASREIDHVAVTGDLVNISLPFEFERAGQFLAAIGDPAHVTLIPGNHDAYLAGVTERGWRSWRPYMEGLGRHEDFPFLRRFGDVVLIGLCSAVPRPPGIASGALGPDQLTRLEVMLDELGTVGLARVVLVHHPPVAGWSRPRKALEDAAAFRGVIARQGAEAVLCGHEHVLNSGHLPGPTGPVPVLGAPSASLLDHEARGPHAGRPRGGYLVHSLERRNDGWQHDCVRRWIAEDGVVREDEVAATLVASRIASSPSGQLGMQIGVS